MTKAETFIEEKLLPWLEDEEKTCRRAGLPMVDLVSTKYFIKEHETEWREE